MKAALSILTLLLGISSCEDDCSGTYNCPDITNSVPLPADTSAPVASAAGDTCTARLDARFSEIDVESTTHRPCHLRLELADGTRRESTVTFVPVPCCGTTVRATPFEAADGGAD